MALALASCSGGTADSGGASAPATTVTGIPSSSASTPGSPIFSASASDELERRVDEAVRLAVRDHGAEPSQLVVIRAERVEWPDSGFGCPVTGEIYEPGPFPGYLVELRHGELEYSYMSGEDIELRECLFLE